jgi:Tol biopolymer transport system component
MLDVADRPSHGDPRSQQPFEAPNWNADGSALIYNSSGRGETRGRLFRFDLATRSPRRSRRHSESRQQRSRPLVRRHRCSASATRAPGGVDDLHRRDGGGTPKRITPQTPSYLHGWSPDGKWLVYTGAGTKSSTSTRSRPTAAVPRSS